MLWRVLQCACSVYYIVFCTVCTVFVTVCVAVCVLSCVSACVPVCLMVSVPVCDAVCVTVCVVVCVTVCVFQYVFSSVWVGSFIFVLFFFPLLFLVKTEMISGVCARRWIHDSALMVRRPMLNVKFFTDCYCNCCCTNM